MRNTTKQEENLREARMSNLMSEEEALRVQEFVRS